MKQKIKQGSILILYHKQKPKIQGVCIDVYKDHCVLRSLQSGYDFKVFYSNPCLKVCQVKDIDFSFLWFLDFNLRLQNINFRVFRELNYGN